MKIASKIGLAAGVAVVAGATALPWVSSRQVAKTLQEMASKPAKSGDVVLSHLEHKAGWLNSEGSVDVTLRSRCAEEEEAQQGLQLRVQYRVQHWPTPSGLNAFSWTVTPQGQAAEAFKAVFGQAAPLSGDGHVTWSRGIQSALQLPAVSLTRGGEVLEASPSQGQLTVSGHRVALEWHMDQAQLRAKDMAFKLQALAVNMDLDNWQRGTGDMALRIGQASTRDLALEGLSVATSTREHDGKLDTAIRNHLQRASWGQQELKEMALDMALKGMHAASVEQLTTLWEQSCGVDRMTLSEQQTLQKAIRTLLSTGMSLQVERLKGESKSGGLDGQLTVTINPATESGAIELAKVLASNGQIKLKGDLATPELRQTGLAMGWLRPTPDGLESNYRYERGGLKVLDRSVDASGIQRTLAMADQAILAMLERRDAPVLASRDNDEDEHEATEAAAPAEPAPATANAMAATEAAMPAPEPARSEHPTTAAAPTCGNVDGCVRATFQAAWREDVGAVRELASQWDALPRPAPGNRAQARRLNEQALALLKTGQARQAADVLGQAAQEDPRDVEVLNNLGFALLRAEQPQEAVRALSQALLLDPRRAATWGPLSEALALSGRRQDALCAMWVAWQWSSQRERLEAMIQDRANKHRGPHLQAAETLDAAYAWVNQGVHPPR